MDQSYSESDVTLSPSQILERLQMLRQLQLMQRGKLQKQCLQYQETSESSSCITEMISHFTNSVNSTSYNTFQSVLQSPRYITREESPRHSISNISQKLHEKDLVEGVSILNLSQESEFITNTPTSGRSKLSVHLTSNNEKTSHSNGDISATSEPEAIKSKKKQISLDEMPILSPRKDFESLVLEKLQSDKSVVKSKCPKKDDILVQKKPFLRRGEGLARFGINRNNIVIQNTKSLPWKKKNVESKPVQSPLQNSRPFSIEDKNISVQILVPDLKLKENSKHKTIENNIISCKETQDHSNSHPSITNKDIAENDTSECSIHSLNNDSHKIIKFPKGKHPLLVNKGKTWASVLTKEQNDFLNQLKQSDYYKNFASPAKSIVSEMSCDENTLKLRQEKECAEQNLFELLEDKVSHSSFNLENSFFNRFLRKSNLECSGESTPMVLQKCLTQNPNLLHILPDSHQKQNRDNNDAETCHSEYTECCSDACSSVSSCCSCKTIEPATPETCHSKNFKMNKEVQKKVIDKNCQDDVDKQQETLKANMEEMNAKLISTSDLLKERLRELEDEIETFRNENINLNKLKEEVELERQKFYEEKNVFEQKFNEEKILSEYYLAEEKDKLNKQKQMYERYVREIRGRLNKKEKDEVINLKQDINNLKEEIKIKDAKSTSTIARLRNQLKIMDKEKKELQNEIDKLNKENRRIRHSNDITRRLTNMKYLEQINKKLSNMNTQPQSEIELSSDVKYKAFEIERQSRHQKAIKSDINRRRAKSVPNLKVTSRYAKYFSQRDASSEIKRNATLQDEAQTEIENYNLDDEDDLNDNENCDPEDEDCVSDSENTLEKIYMDTFRTTSPKNNKSTKSNTNNDYLSVNSSGDISNGFFLQKTNSSSSTRDSNSPLSSFDRGLNGSSKSPISILSHRSNQRSINSHNSLNQATSSNSLYRSKSPLSVATNHSSQRSATVIEKDLNGVNILTTISPEPSSSKVSLVKTNLNPTETRRPDGSRELRFPNGNVKYISADGQYCKFVYYNGDVKENFYNEGRIKYYYSESKTYHTTHPDGLEVLEFPDGQVEKRYKDGSSEIRLPNGSVRYHDPKNKHVREEWRFPDGSALTVSANSEKRIVFPNGQVEVHSSDHKRREFPDGTVKLVYNDGTSETRYASGRVRIKDKHGHLIMDSAPR